LSWWVPLAVVGAILAGVVIAMSLTAGRPRGRAAAEEVFTHGDRPRSRYQEDNELVWNPAAFIAAAALLGGLVLVAVLIQVL